MFLNRVCQQDCALLISPGAPSHGATEPEKKDVQFLAKKEAWKGLEGGVNRPSKCILLLPLPQILRGPRKEAGPGERCGKGPPWAISRSGDDKAPECHRGDGARTPGKGGPGQPPPQSW